MVYSQRRMLNGRKCVMGITQLPSASAIIHLALAQRLCGQVRAYICCVNIGPNRERNVGARVPQHIKEQTQVTADSFHFFYAPVIWFDLVAADAREDWNSIWLQRGGRRERRGASTLRFSRSTPPSPPRGPGLCSLLARREIEQVGPLVF